MDIDSSFMSGYAQMRPGAEYGSALPVSSEMTNKEHVGLFGYLSEIRKSGESDKIFEDANTNSNAQRALGWMAAGEYKQYLRSTWKDESFNHDSSTNAKSNTLDKVESIWNEIDKRVAAHQRANGNADSAAILES
jgi:hypothetical protein